MNKLEILKNQLVELNNKYSALYSSLTECSQSLFDAYYAERAEIEAQIAELEAGVEVEAGVEAEVEAEVEVEAEGIDMVSGDNLATVIKWAGVTKKLVDKRTMPYMEIMDSIRSLVTANPCFIFNMVTRHDGASIYFYDAEDQRYEYDITIYPDGEVVLSVNDTQTKKTISSLEF